MRRTKQQKQAAQPCIPGSHSLHHVHQHLSPTSLWSYQESLITSWRESKNAKLGLQIEQLSMWCLKMGAAALQPHSGVVLKDGSEGKFSYWAEFRVMHLFTHFTWKRWLEVTIYPDSWAGTQERVRLKEWNKEVVEHMGVGTKVWKSLYCMLKPTREHQLWRKI